MEGATISPQTDRISSKRAATGNRSDGQAGRNSNRGGAYSRLDRWGIPTGACSRSSQSAVEQNIAGYPFVWYLARASRSAVACTCKCIRSVAAALVPRCVGIVHRTVTTGRREEMGKRMETAIKRCLYRAHDKPWHKTACRKSFRKCGTWSFAWAVCVLRKMILHVKVWYQWIYLNLAQFVGGWYRHRFMVGNKNRVI